MEWWCVVLPAIVSPYCSETRNQRTRYVGWCVLCCSRGPPFREARVPDPHRRAGPGTPAAGLCNLGQSATASPAMRVGNEAVGHCGTGPAPPCPTRHADRGNDRHRARRGTARRTQQCGSSKQNREMQPTPRAQPISSPKILSQIRSALAPFSAPGSGWIMHPQFDSLSRLGSVPSSAGCPEPHRRVEPIHPVRG
jgi:hypothetical protein